VLRRFLRHVAIVKAESRDQGNKGTRARSG
jgi:hypothetical protein